MTSGQSKTIDIPFSVENIKLCRCPICPVQHDSQCTKEQLNQIQETVKANPIDPQKVPAEYCSQGPAACDDIDPSQTCICDTCEVFVEYTLTIAQPDGYFCTQGKPASKQP